MAVRRCFFIGHRNAPETLLPALEEAVERHIARDGVAEFLVGGYGGFDRLAARAVLRAKERHPGVMLTLLQPYHPFDRPTEKPEGFDDVCYPSGMETVPRRFAIARANRYAVDHADFLIVYAHFPASNARNLAEYAERRAARGLIRITYL